MAFGILALMVACFYQISQQIKMSESRTTQLRLQLMAANQDILDLKDTVVRYKRGVEGL